MSGILDRINASFDRMEANFDRIDALLQAILDHLDGKRLKGPPMSEHIRDLLKHHADQLRSDCEASRRGRLLESEPDKPLPDVPLHKRGFGVMDEDQP